MQLLTVSNCSLAFVLYCWQIVECLCATSRVNACVYLVEFSRPPNLLDFGNDQRFFAEDWLSGELQIWMQFETVTDMKRPAIK
jgi:hypothetical protein